MANPILWQRWNGISDSLWSGVKNSFYKLRGVDIHSAPGSITVHQRLDKDSGTTIDALCRVVVAVSDGSKLWFSYTSGKIWRESGGTYTLVYTTSPAAGTAGCLGAAEFNAFIYWATQSRLHRISTANIATAQNWTDNAVPNWKTFSATDADFHPMVVTNAALFIGDANQVAKVDSAAAFTGTGNLNLVAPIRIKTMAALDIDIVIGTLIATSVNYCHVIRWDTVLTTWQFMEPVWENGVNAFLWTGTVLLAQAGTSGNWYYYDGQFLRPYKRIPGTWSPTQRAEVYPQAVGMLRGVPIFGLTNLAWNAADQGIYSFGNYSKDYPVVLSGPDFIISENVVEAVTIGAIIVDGQDLYVSWAEGADFAVDQLNYSVKYGAAFLETPRITLDAEKLVTLYRFFANYQSLPSGTSLAFLYKKNNDASYNALTEVDDTNIAQVYAEEAVEARAIQFRIEFTVSSNNAPVVEAMGILPAN